MMLRVAHGHAAQRTHWPCATEQILFGAERALRADVDPVADLPDCYGGGIASCAHSEQGAIVPSPVWVSCQPASSISVRVGAGQRRVGEELVGNQRAGGCAVRGVHRLGVCAVG